MVRPSLERVSDLEYGLARSLRQMVAQGSGTEAAIATLKTLLAQMEASTEIVPGSAYIVVSRLICAALTIMESEGESSPEAVDLVRTALNVLEPSSSSLSAPPP